MIIPRTRGKLGRATAMSMLFLAACQERQALPEKPQTLVATQTVELTDYAPTVRLTGEIRARVQSDLSFRVSGRVVERNVEVGTRVEAKDIIARIDPEEQEANVASAEANVRAAEAQLRQASSVFERQKTLLSSGYTTRREHDQAEEALRTAEGTVDAARAQLASARDQLDQTVLRAGVAGVITARQVEVGQVVQAAQPVFSLAHDGPRDAVFSVHESIFTRAAADNSVEISLLSDPKVKASGAVREVAPTVDPTSGTVRVKVGIERPPPEMTLGAAVTGEGRFKARKLVVLPWSALSSEGGHPAVWIVDAQTKAVSLRRITVERYHTGSVVVADGIRPGETVVSAGGQLLRPNQTVELTGTTS